MERGWIKLYRKLQDNPLWKSEPFTRGQAWVDLLLIANHKEGVVWKRGNCIKIARGQVGWSMKGLADRWQWSRTKVNTFLEWLETEQQIVQQKTKLSTLITIIKFDEYNSKVQQTGQQKDNRSATEVQQKDTNKNGKKGKNVKKEDIELPEWMPLEAWDGFVEMRIKLKSPLTKRATTLIINKLKKFKDENYDIGELLDTATMNNWKSIYPPKDNNTGKAEIETNKYDKLKIIEG